jgi:hypothetical protein
MKPWPTVVQLRRAALLLLSTTLLAADAKVVDGTIKLSSQTTEQYIGDPSPRTPALSARSPVRFLRAAKFSFSPWMRSHVTGKFHTTDGTYFDRHPHQLALCLYKDTQWDKMQALMKKGSLCTDRMSLASYKWDVQPNYVEGTGKHDFTFSQHLQAPSVRTHYWWVMIMDCYLEEYDAHPAPMEFEMTFTNGESQLPEDESGMLKINWLAFLSMSAYGGFYFVRALQQMRRLKQAHLITLLFAVAYALQTASVLCEILHLRRYSQDGKGLRWRHTWLALDFGGGLCQSVSELLISVLLIALAFGWTLGLESQEPLEGAAGKLLAGLQRPAQLRRGLRSPSALLLGSIFAVQLFLQAAGRRYEEDFNNFHDHEHWPGLMLILIRLLLCALFGWALRRSVAVESQREVLAFFAQLRLAGFVWFLCLPLLVALAFLCPPHRRHQIVAGGSIILQAAALALLSTLFLERSEYAAGPHSLSPCAVLGSTPPHGALSMAGTTRSPRSLTWARSSTRASHPPRLRPNSPSTSGCWDPSKLGPRSFLRPG